MAKSNDSTANVAERFRSAPLHSDYLLDYTNVVMKGWIMCRHFLLAFAMWLALPTFAAPTDERAGEKSVSLHGSNGAHTFIVKITRQAFDKTKHVIKRRHRFVDDEKYWAVGTIDGRKPIGVSDQLPGEELCTFTAIVDGKPWKVQSSLWRDVYEPVLSPDRKLRPSRAAVSKDGKCLWIKIEGGDGIASYRVEWYLRADGKNTRKITDTEE